MAQTTPAKPQLPTTPSPGAQPSAPRQVIIQPDTTNKRSVKTAEPAPNLENAEKEEKEKVPLRDRLMYSGNFGLQFGDVTFVQLMPTVGYKLTKKIVAGPGVIYQYESYRGIGSFHSYGGKVFGRALVYDNFFLHSEYEMLNTFYLEVDNVRQEIRERRVNINALLAGGGYRQMIGDRTSVDIMVLFDLIDSQYSPYSSPIVRIGFSGGW